jgi:poly(ADP-ribose) polymerase-like protein
MAAGNFEFSSFSKIVRDAYHGTDVANIDSIQKNGFRIGTGSDLHLGSGVYFYEGSKSHALTYLKQKSKDKDRKIAVFRCEISLGNCLDLNNGDHKEALRSFASKIRAAAYNSAEFRKKHSLVTMDDVTASFIINLAAETAQADSVRASYGGDQALFEGCQIPSNSRLVIAVRNPKKILATHLEYSDN